METKKTSKANLEKNKLLFLEIGLIIVLGIVLIALEWTTRPTNSSSLNFPGEDIGEEELTIITRYQEEKPEPPPPPPKIVDILNIVANDEKLNNPFELDNMEIKEDFGFDIPQYKEEPDDKELDFFVVEDKPKFQGGGHNAFSKWIYENLQYPDIAAENGISGRVFMQFTINSKGEVVDAKVTRGVDPNLDKEALRVVSSSPLWEPGKQRGRPVNVRFSFSIFFVLQ
jgi:protein TonB